MPFLPLILAGASLLGRFAGNASRGRAEGRAAEAQLNTQRDRLALDRWQGQESGQLDRYRTQQQSLLEALGLTERGRMSRAELDLARRRFGLDVPRELGRQSAMGDVLSSFRPRRATHPRANVVNFELPFELSGQTRDLGRLMSERALARMQAGEQFEDVPETDFAGGVLPPPAQSAMPGLSQIPRATGLDRFLNILSGVGGAASAAQPFIDSLNQYTLPGRRLPVGNE